MAKCEGHPPLPEALRALAKGQLLLPKPILLQWRMFWFLPQGQDSEPPPRRHLAIEACQRLLLLRKQDDRPRPRRNEESLWLFASTSHRNLKVQDSCVTAQNFGSITNVAPG